MNNLLRFYNSLFAPHPSLTKSSERRKARLFVFFTLHLIPLLCFVFILQYSIEIKGFTPVPPLLALLIIGLSLFFYIMARSPYYRTMIFLQIGSNAILCCYILLEILPDEVASVSGFNIGIIEAALLLSFQHFIYSIFATFIVVAFCLLMHPSPHILIGSIVVTIIITGFIYIIRLHLEQVEYERKNHKYLEEEKLLEFISRIFDGVAIIEDDLLVRVDPSFALLLNLKTNDILQESIHEHLPGNIDLSLSLQSISLLDDNRGIRFIQVLYEKTFYSEKQLMAVRDITNQEMQQEQLFFTNRMISTGMLTASIIHDISNPLMVLQHNIDSMTTQEISLKETQINAVRESIDHISSLFDTLSHYVRPQKKNEDTHIVIAQAVQLIQSHIRCHFHQEISPLAQSNIPQNELLQILINLLMNALHVVQPKDHITIRAQQHDTTITITIEDTGPGIPSKIQNRIFEPFFTTKTNGTGLGLAITQKILMAHGGRITLDTTYEQGCRFVISINALASAPQKTSRDILLVDDEPLICELIAEALEAHHITTVPNAEEGIALIENNSYGLILCDVSLPQKNGWEVYRHWKSKRSGGAFVFITGGIHLLASQKELEEENIEILSKPFHLVQLYALVEKYIPQEKQNNT